MAVQRSSSAQSNAGTQGYWHKPVATRPVAWQGVFKLAEKIATRLQGIFLHYTDTPVTFKLLSASQNPVYFWEIQDFYVAQKALSSVQTIRLRLSTTLCDKILTASLGPSETQKTDFALARMQGFEVFLLEQFGRQIIQDMSDLPRTLTRYDMDAGHGEQVHFHWGVFFDEKNDSTPQHVVLSLPFDLVDALASQHMPADAHTAPADDEASLNDDFLLSCYAAGVSFRLGASRIRIQDLDELSYEDVVVLDNSRLDTWHLWDDANQYWVTIPVSLPIESEIPRYHAPLGDSNPMKHVSPQSLSWDNLQVDLVANFQPMKFPIKRIKELSEGLILEVSGLMDNKINLTVDGQPVAWGELVVVGDKFAVRIQGLYKPDPSKGHSEDERQYRTVSADGPTGGADGQDMDLLKELDMGDGDFNDNDDWS